MAPTILTDRAKLEAMLANTREPILDEDTIETLLADALVRDGSGRWTDDADYVETFDLNLAAARGWRIKAGLVAADYSIVIEKRGLSRSELIKNFLTMAKTYAALAGPRSARPDGGDQPRFLWER